MENPTSVLIVEDEQTIATRLKNMLEKKGYRVTAIVDNASDALNAFREDMPDLLLMDIKINGPLDGIETAKLLLKIKKVPVIFVSTFAGDEGTFDKASMIDPDGVLPKSYNEISLVNTIKLAIKRFQNKQLLEGFLNSPPEIESPKSLQRGCLIFKIKDKRIKVAYEDVIWVKSERNDLIIKTVTGESYSIYQSLTQFEKTHDYPYFGRCHRSYLINLLHVDDDNLLPKQLSVNKEVVPVGRSFKNTIEEKIIELMEEGILKL